MRLSKRKRSLAVVMWGAAGGATAAAASASGPLHQSQDSPPLLSSTESNGRHRRRGPPDSSRAWCNTVPPLGHRSPPAALQCANSDGGARPPYPSHSAWLQFDTAASPGATRTSRSPADSSSTDPDERNAEDEGSRLFSPRDSRTGERDYEGAPPPAPRLGQTRHESSPRPTSSSSFFFQSSDSSAGAPRRGQKQQRQHSPLLYRYYGKSRSRTPGSGSLPFVLFGPNVDHFKLIGQELASRGFSVIACERVLPEDGGSAAPGRDPAAPERRPQRQPQEPDPQPRSLEDGAVLMEELLDALRWSRVVLVGCDSEAALAVQAAVRLAPSGRVAGLVLCGDLKHLQDDILQSGWDVTVNGIRSTNRLLIDSFVLDLFLREHVTCPFTIVWAGDEPSLPAAQALASPELDAVEAMLSNRYVILGGGAAPHRRRPELFAWVLTRFVEEKIAGTAAAGTPQQQQQPVLAKRGGQQDSPYGDEFSSNPNAAPEPRPLNRLVRLQEFFSPGSFLVTGRVVATMIFYWAIMKVGIHQFDNICAGMVNVQSAVKHVQSWRATTFRFVGRLFSKLGGLFLITSYSSPTKAAPSDSTSSTEVQDADASGISESADGALNGPNKTDPNLVASEGDADLENPTPESSGSPDNVAPRLPISEDPNKGESDASTPEPEKERRKPLFFLDHIVA